MTICNYYYLVYKNNGFYFATVKFAKQEDTWEDTGETECGSGTL
jgi:hypothetical protein